MGCFDTFKGYVRCSVCGKKHYFEEQTKDYECLLQCFELGDYIDLYNSNYIYKFKYPCKKYPTNLFMVNIIIRNGQIIKFLNNEELNSININKLKNIEEGYQKKLNYKILCNKGVGLGKENIDFKLHPFKIGQTINVLNNDWIIEEIYEEVLNNNIKNKKVKQFYECVFQKSYVYKVKGILGKRIIRIKENNVCEVFYNTNMYQDLSCFTKENIHEFYLQCGTILSKLNY